MLRNSLAHLIARIAVMGAGIAAIPLVTLTLGQEALGLVGLYATMQTMLGLFDLGLPVAVNHRLAVMIGRGRAPAAQAELVRTLEILFWIFVAVFFVAGFVLRGVLADHWLNFNDLSRTTVISAFVMMTAAAAIRFPVAFYSNVLYAYGRHIFPNVVTASVAVLRIVASLVALVEFDVGIIGFFLIQLLGSATEVALLAGGIWLRHPFGLAQPRWSVLYDIRALAGGLTLISLTAVALSQIDKIVLSKLLSLGDFGLYSAGYAVAAGLVALSYPVGNAVFPQLSRALDTGRADIKRIIRAATELTILIVIPIGCVVIMQAEPLLRLLFLVKPLPAALAIILPLFMAGAIAQSFVTLPHLYQVAAKRAMTVVWINAGFLIPYGIGILVTTAKGGIFAAAAAFAVFNVARLLVHWALLTADRAARSRWGDAIGLTLAASVAGPVLAAAPLAFEFQGAAAVVVAVLTVSALAFIAVLAMPHSRERLSIVYRESCSPGEAGPKGKVRVGRRTRPNKAGSQNQNST